MYLRIILLTFLIFFSTLIGFSQKDRQIKKIENYLNQLSQDENFGLSIAISKNEKVILQNAFGYANRSHKTPNQIDTKFNIASIGKMFTAVSILKLYEQKKIDLYLPIGKYIPDFPNKNIRDSVTIDQLLSHQSGLPLWFSPTFAGDPKFSFHTLEDYFPFFDSISVDQKKVGKNNYSNVGYFMLGVIIESVSGLPYQDYLEKNIFHPAKMNDTRLWHLTAVIPNAASGYVRPADKNDFWKTNLYKNMNGNPAGGAYSTVLDLLKFYDALKNNQLLSAKTTALILQPKFKPDGWDYGYGITFGIQNEQKIMGHLGGFFGIRGELMWFQNSDYTVAILANSDQTDYIDISHFIEVLLSGTKDQIVAFENTLTLLEKINQNKIEVKGLEMKVFENQKFDEALIQIKGYHFFNNQDYKNAEILFRLNTILFPESESAKNDLARIPD
ncbi:MAG: serine hydrolase domain-containing protein [Saprospiraceae bacterium]